MLSGCIRDASACLTELRQRQNTLGPKRLAEFLHAQLVNAEKAMLVVEIEHKNGQRHHKADAAAYRFQNDILFGLPDECVKAIMHNFEGEDLVLASRVCSRFRRLATDSVLWLELCCRLEGYCEDRTLEISTQRNTWTDWARLYKCLQREAVCRVLTSGVDLPHSATMETKGTMLRYSGEIGSDRAARAKEGWSLPPSLDNDSTISRLGLIAKVNFWGTKAVAWDVPPLLVSCDGGRRARYIHGKCRYFEVKVLPHSEPELEPAADGSNSMASERWCIAVGVSTSSFSLEGMQPGWDLNSCAYHGDDGRVFFGNTCVSSFPKFGPGDTVGCGMSCDGGLFFTRNGAFLGFVRDVTQHLCNARGTSRVLYPTVGVDSLCPVEINWGRRPFEYGFEEAGREGLSHVDSLTGVARRIGAGWPTDRLSQLIEEEGGQCAIQ